MFLTQDQISTAKANLEANVSLYFTLTSKTLESLEKLATLNVTAIKASMEESVATTRQLMAAKDAQEWLALVNAQAKPNVAKVVAYAGHVASIATDAQAEYSKATETQITEAARKVNELVSEAAKKAPAGSDAFTNLFKTTMDNASAGYEQLTKSTRQAVDAFNANVNGVVNQMAKTTTDATTTVKA
ncbi:TIGR01841 family phasin [Noviherbaspirillum galbum]|uniref:TIGR01841 family phasin n=1 Tax=Noviherbaspirillum galbum TaxID=2709383 RepID=A0A6B3SQS8_9BURK|nr:TIGR01841 family phasin [Noviherbaspirillum galbum]NEX60762.1 TIGR01841 family phasin [Noviherbaspirillum galbum]